MQFAQLNNDNIYIGMVNGIAAASPDVGFYAPEGVRISPLGPPPADEPGRWRDAGNGGWIEVSLDEARAAKLAEISAAFEQAGRTAHVRSSLGFEIDANERANRDVEGLITVLTATGAPGTMFCDYNNVMREVTLEQLKTLRLEIIAHGQALYAKKWLLREAVGAAQTLAEIQAVVWEDGE